MELIYFIVVKGLFKGKYLNLKSMCLDVNFMKREKSCGADVFWHLVGAFE